MGQHFFEKKIICTRCNVTKIHNLLVPGLREHFLCDTEVDLCYSSPCVNNGTCMRREGGYTCVCAPGFTGSLSLSDFIKLLVMLPKKLRALT